MPRRARLTTEYLHVIVRGIGKQLIFEDDADREFFLSTLVRFRDEQDITIIAYCLMDNHVHLLLRDPDRCVQSYMKKLGVTYAMYFNRKYDRTGHLFQDRYKSENITDDAYLLTVYRYILNNPVKAGIASATAYRWSSYFEYGIYGGITDTSLIQSMIGSKEALSAFLSAEDSNEVMEYEPPKHDDEWAKSIIHRELNLHSGTQLQLYSKADRDAMIAKLKKCGLSIRQIERLTGINRGVIQKA